VKFPIQYTAAALLSLIFTYTHAAPTHKISITGEVTRVDDYLLDGGRTTRPLAIGSQLNIEILLDAGNAPLQAGTEGFTVFNRYSSNDPLFISAAVISGPESVNTFYVPNVTYSARLEYQVRPDNMNVAFLISSFQTGQNGPSAAWLAFQPQEFQYPFRLLGELNGVNTDVRISEYTTNASVFHYGTYNYALGYPVGYEVAFKPTSYEVTAIPEPSSIVLLLVSALVFLPFCHASKKDAKN
jgi:hypothetical protein